MQDHALLFPLWSVIPFAVMLLSIAVVPLLYPLWWDRNLNKLLLSAGASIPVLAVLLPNGWPLLEHSLLDYFSFIVLLGALFVISGGIYIKGEFAGTPAVNTFFLAIGAVLANLIGTTGASMLLIRPYLRANASRLQKSHLVVFFIFVVSNAGGLLTPLGDPPLFLGFLRGVPFQWTLTLFPVWATVVVALLTIFFVYDSRVQARQHSAAKAAVAGKRVKSGLQIQGALNLLFLLGVMAAAILSGQFGWPKGAQEAVMILMAVLSWLTTSRTVHQANHFHFHPILEVAALFSGIFITMIPALKILESGAGTLKLQAAWQYFWMTGVLSSFLDNAPTYLTFAAMASGTVGGSVENLSVLLQSPAGQSMLRAISCGAVLMGAATYIGNGPNFMVKSIAETSRVEMPSFVGYMIYSAVVLLPVFVLVTLLFFI